MKTAVMSYEIGFGALCVFFHSAFHTDIFFPANVFTPNKLLTHINSWCHALRAWLLPAARAPSLVPSDWAEFKETAASWHAGTPNSWKGPVIYSQWPLHTGNMSCLACCLKPLTRFSVYQSEVMLLQRALNAIEKQPRFTKSSSVTFFLQTEHFCRGARTLTASMSLGFVFVCFVFQKKKTNTFPNYNFQRNFLYLQLNPQVPVIQL